MKKDTLAEYEDKWETQKEVGYDILRILFGTILILFVSYLLYTYVIVPFGLIYKISGVVQTIIISIRAFTSGRTMRAVRFRQRDRRKVLCSIGRYHG